MAYYYTYSHMRVNANKRLLVAQGTFTPPEPPPPPDPDPEPPPPSGGTTDLRVLRAFPGAEGGGALTTGGRGGRVIYVTNTNDSGGGSLRAALAESGARIIVFRTGGTITLQSGIEVTNGNFTIAGQTAPGGGIQTRAAKNGARNDISVNVGNTIIRYLRMRRGLNGDKRNNIRASGSFENQIYDHLSLYWGENQNWSIYSFGSTGPRNITMQNSIIAEMIDARVNIVLGTSNSAATLTCVNIDHHNNLVANTRWRNPLMQVATARWVNNIVYNWDNWASRGVGGVYCDWIGNLWKPGPWKKGTQGIQELQFMRYWKNHANPERLINRTPSHYVVGNRGILSGMNPDTDNWSFTRECGVPNSNGTITDNSGVRGPTPAEWRRNNPLPATPIPIIARHVDTLESHLLPIVGASARLDNNGRWVSNRDSTDQRLITQYQNNQGSVSTVVGQTEAMFGGWPTIASGTPYPCTANDGIADGWKVRNGLNINTRYNAAVINGVTQAAQVGPVITAQHWPVNYPNRGWTYMDLFLAGMDLSEVS